MKSLLLAIQFLTIIPVRVSGEVRPEQMGRSVGFFPMAGLLQGLLAAVMVIGLHSTFPPFVLAALILAITIGINGGFHLDGLSDTFDAMAVRSSGNPETDRARRLSVMKDPAAGPIGVSAIFLVLLLKAAALGAIIERASTEFAAAILILVPTISKWSMVPAIVFGRPARPDGLGRLMIENAGASELVTALVTVVIPLGISVLAWWPDEIFPVGLFLGCTFMAFLLSVAAVAYFRRRLGGMTGDLCGAIHEMAEVSSLLLVTAWLGRSI